ncbi:hypothetical protein Tco_1070995 [Tanacetum coccineum]|uniref:Uncharacterized protein n=1 Tax=Tanacetum coccineum TaxID=301880 RepID=A0ABQ5HN80_9ASTR
MSDSEDSTVTYTTVSSPFRGMLDIGSSGVDGPPVMPEDPYAYVVAAFQSPPSPDYVPGPEEPEQAPLSLEFVHERIYMEFMPPEDEVFPAEEQPRPAAILPTADSPGYIADSDPEEDPTDYPIDGGYDDDDESSKDDEDDDDDVEEEEDEKEEEEEHPAPADSIPPHVHRVTVIIEYLAYLKCMESSTIQVFFHGDAIMGQMLHQFQGNQRDYFSNDTFRGCYIVTSFPLPHPIIILSDSDVEDTFFSTHSPDYIPASPDYFPASSGNTSSNFLDDLTKDLLASLSLSPFYDDPYMKVVQAFYAKELTIPPPDHITPPAILTPSSVLPPSLLFDPRYFFVPEELLPPKKQIHPPSSSSTTLSNSSKKNFDEVKTKLREARTQILELQKKHMGQRDKIALVHFRISDLEMTLEDIQDRHQLYMRNLMGHTS